MQEILDLINQFYFKEFKIKILYIIKYAITFFSFKDNFYIFSL